MTNKPTEVVFDDARVRSFLYKIEKKSDELTNKSRKVLGIIAGVVYRDIMDHFANSEGPNGQWPKWSTSYAAFMESIGKGGNNILIDSGRLRQSFTPNSYRLEHDGILFYNNAKTAQGFPYAAAHNAGIRGKERKFMWLSDKGLDSISEQLLQFLVEDV